MRVAMLGLRAVGRGSGGVERAVVEIGARLAERGHEVTVFCRARYAQAGGTAHRGMRVRRLPAIYTKHLEAISNTALAVCFACRGFDVVHIHATGPALLSFVPRLAGRRVVVTVHGLDWRREKWKWPAKLVLRMGAWAAARFPHSTVVVSRSLAEHYRARYGRDTVCIANGVSAGEVRPLERLKRFGVEPGGYVLFLGRLVPEKGCHLLIEAYRRVDTAKKLLIAGEAAHTEEYVARLRALAAGDARVVFAGGLYGADKDEAYGNAACFVLPSTLEGMPLTLLEAMSFGCPVLCSDIAENLEIAAPGAAGTGAGFAATFRSGSVEDLAARLAALLAAPEAARRTAAAARAHVLAAYSWDLAAERTEAVYASLLEAPGGIRSRPFPGNGGF
jgi:glycosyltransferase involved in cell wall biosynthesis